MKYLSFIGCVVAAAVFGFLSYGVSEDFKKDGEKIDVV